MDIFDFWLKKNQIYRAILAMFGLIVTWKCSMCKQKPEE